MTAKLTGPSTYSGQAKVRISSGHKKPFFAKPTIDFHKRGVKLKSISQFTRRPFGGRYRSFTLYAVALRFPLSFVLQTVIYEILPAVGGTNDDLSSVAKAKPRLASAKSETSRVLVLRSP